MATRTCLDCSLAEVNNCWNGVAGGGNRFSTPIAAGDTVILPAGTATWTSALDLNGIEATLQGATTVQQGDENSFTTVAAGSNGASLPQSDIFVASTTNFPASGRFYIQSSATQTNPKDLQVVQYTSKGTGVFHGCTAVTSGAITYPCGGTLTTGYYVIGIIATDLTIINDNIPGLGSRIIMTSVDFPGVNNTRISGLSFNGLIVTSGQFGLAFSGYTEKFRIDNCHFHNLGRTCILTNGQAGVVDHCVFYDGVANTTFRSIEVKFSYWGFGSGNDNGHSAFADNSYFGSGKTMYVENCLHWCLGQLAAIPDTEQGGRCGIRHDIVCNDISRGHGTEASTARGSRLREVYKSTFIGTGVFHGGAQLRGGVEMFWGNTFDVNYNTGTCHATQSYRAFEEPSTNTIPVDYTIQWGAGDGRSPWDINATRSDGSYHIGEPSYLFWTGTITALTQSGNVSVTVTVDNAAGITADKFQYHQLLDTQASSARKNVHNTIQSHTGDDGSGHFTMTFSGAFSGRTPLPTFAVGDSVAIYRPLTYVDQAGRGKTDYPDFNNPRWLNCQLEPVYLWLNRRLGGIFPGASNSPGVSLENRDYYDEAAAVGGVQTVGVGVGPLANRPASGVNGFDVSGSTVNPPGTGYFATDVVNPAADNGALYVWKGGAWVLWYTPYFYPHPFVTGAVGTGKIIALSGNLNFGDVIVGQTATATLVVADQGDTTITVSSVSYDAPWTGATTGFTVAAGATHNITVTFSPISLGPFSGNVRVFSDATVSPATIAATGTGIAAGGGGIGPSKLRLLVE